ncbi:MAG: peptide ABC transporter substrate-binding protein [Acutalibacteraceae bacterium]
MLKRVLSVFLCLILMMLTLASCSSDGTGKQMITPIDIAPEYLDPQITSEIGARNIIANCFEGLVGIDENNGIIPAAAENYNVSDDGLVYTFNLRKDAKWHVTSDAGKTIGEGYETSFDTDVTADDFVFGLRRALLPETKSPYAHALFCIKNASSVYSGKLSENKLGVEAIDDYTLKITLERYDPDFLYTLTTPACMPCNEEFFEMTGGRYGLSTQYLIYNGPFYISTITDTSVITKKNEEYHSVSSVKPASVYFTIKNEQETRGKKVKDGTYEAALLTAAQADELSAGKGVTVKPFLSGELSLLFNCKDEILSNIDIRRAISLSFNEKPLLELTGLSSASGVVPGGLKIGDTEYRKKAASFDLSEDENAAKKYLKSGLEALEADDIELTVLCTSEYETAVRTVMQSWQSLFGVSFNVSVEAVESAELSKRISEGNYQLALYNLRCLDSSAFSAVYRFTSFSRDNPVGLNETQYDNIVLKIKKSKTEQQIIDAIEEAEAYLISCAVVIPICETDVYIGLAKGVEGIVFSAAGDTMYFKNAVKK